MSTMRLVRHKIAKSQLHRVLAWKRHRGIRPEDVFVASYPRSGNTWLRFMLYELLAGQSSSFRNVDQLLPDVGKQGQASPVFPQGGRLIKTHEPYRAEYKKAIYLVRDARDVALSEFAYQKALGFIPDDFERHVKRFLGGKVNPFGSWVAHVESWMRAKEEKRANILLLRYDEMRRAPEDSLAGVMEFLGLPVQRELIQRVVANNSVEKMRAKEKITPVKASVRGRFVGDGAVGGWNQRFTPAQVQLFQRYAGAILDQLGYSVVTQ